MPSTQEDCPNPGSGERRRLPDSISAEGKTRTVSRHLKEATHSGITANRIVHVLEHWLLRGVLEEGSDRQSMNYLAFVPGLTELVRVAISADDSRIITAFPDRTATRHWNRGNRAYFTRTYRNMEERNESALR